MAQTGLRGCTGSSLESSLVANVIGVGVRTRSLLFWPDLSTTSVLIEAADF